MRCSSSVQQDSEDNVRRGRSYELGTEIWKQGLEMNLLKARKSGCPTVTQARIVSFCQSFRQLQPNTIRRSRASGLSVPVALRNATCSEDIRPPSPRYFRRIHYELNRNAILIAFWNACARIFRLFVCAMLVPRFSRFALSQTRGCSRENRAFPHLAPDLSLIPYISFYIGRPGPWVVLVFR